MNATDDGESRADELSGEDAAREVVLVTGISGSGKSVALHALEDAGFFQRSHPPTLTLKHRLPPMLRHRAERE